MAPALPGCGNAAWVAGALFLAEPDQGELAKWRHGAAFDQAHPLGAGGPGGVSLPRELGTPTELAGGRRKPMLQRAPQPRLRADPADQHDLAARLEDARELVERALGIRHRRDHVLRDHDIERVVG